MTEPRLCPHDLAEKEMMCADGYCPMCTSKKIEELKKENERLRGALEKIVSFACTVNSIYGQMCGRCTVCIAKHALDAKGEE